MRGDEQPARAAVCAVTNHSLCPSSAAATQSLSLARNSFDSILFLDRISTVSTLKNVHPQDVEVPSSTKLAAVTRQCTAGRSKAGRQREAWTKQQHN